LLFLFSVTLFVDENSSVRLSEKIIFFEQTQPSHPHRRNCLRNKNVDSFSGEKKGIRRLKILVSDKSEVFFEEQKSICE
jgi:hypothetical protein